MPKQRWTTSDLNLIKEFIAAKKSAEFIAAHFETSVANIRMLLHRHQISMIIEGSGTPSSLKRKQKEHDIATRIRVLRGEELRQTKAVAYFSDEQLHKWLNTVEGFDLFCREVLNVELQPYQLDMAKSMINSRRSCFVMGRQSGKDFTISCFVIWLSITNSNKRTLLVSAAQRQSDLLFNRIMNFIAQSLELFDSVDKSNMELLRFKNASEVYNLPATGQIRGFTEVSHIFVNEVAHGVSDETVHSVLVPMLATTNGSLVLMSSPAGMNGVLWESFNNPLFNSIQLPSSVNSYVTREWLESARKEMPAIQYSTEVEAQFSQSLDVYFNESLVRKCTKAYDFYSFAVPNREYYAGVDIGRIKDFSCITVLEVDEEGNKKIVKIVTLENKPFDAQKKEIEKLHEQFRFNKICVERAGLSLQFCEDLKNMHLPIMEFTPTADSKAEAYNFLLKEMEEGKLTIPNHDLLQYELRTFTYEVSKSGKMLLHHASEQGHDDHVDSLCFANWATKNQQIDWLGMISCGKSY